MPETGERILAMGPTHLANAQSFGCSKREASGLSLPDPMFQPLQVCEGTRIPICEIACRKRITGHFARSSSDSFQ